METMGKRSRDSGKQDRAAGTPQNLLQLVEKKKDKLYEAPKCVSGVPSTPMTGTPLGVVLPWGRGSHCM
jgi:hypothetical protein